MFTGKIRCNLLCSKELNITLLGIILDIYYNLCLLLLIYFNVHTNIIL